MIPRSPIPDTSATGVAPGLVPGVVADAATVQPDNVLVGPPLRGRARSTSPGAGARSHRDDVDAILRKSTSSNFPGYKTRGYKTEVVGGNRTATATASPPTEGRAHQTCDDATAKGEKFVLGVTGNIASGKSTVVNRLVEHGAVAIDADLVYRELVGPGQPLLATLADRFGDHIVAPDGSLDRAALGKIVFSDPEKLAELDALTHPAVIAEIDRRVDSIDAGIVVIDAVKLIESGHADRCDSVWIVTIDTEVQMTRLMKRNRLSLLEARRRVDAQPPMAAKLARADRVIDNSGEIEDTMAQVDAGWREIVRRMAGRAG